MGQVILVLVKRIVGLFELCISGLTLTIDSIPSCGLCEGDFVRSSPYYWAVPFVKCFESNGKAATQGRVYVRKPGRRKNLWTWNFSERVEVEIEYSSGEDV